MIRFPRRARFYGFSAVIMGIFGILFAAFLDFSFVPFFLWAFIFILIGAAFSNPIIILLCTVFIPLYPLLALLNTFQTSSGRLAEMFIFSSWATKESWISSIQIALLFLPVLLLFTRSLYLYKRKIQKAAKIKPNLRKRIIAILIVATFLIFLIIVQILILKNKNPVEKEYINEVFEIGIHQNEKTMLFIDDAVFQDSRIITIHLEAKGKPICFNIWLESKNENSLLPVYSAPVPFYRNEDGRSFNFSLGENPDNPLTMEIVLPLEFEGILNTQTIYNEWDEAIDTGEKPDYDNYFLLVSKSMELDATRRIQD
jgi:heme/copper-type cytochrome/quinol oxidase subunit 2